MNTGVHGAASCSAGVVLNHKIGDLRFQVLYWERAGRVAIVHKKSRAEARGKSAVQNRPQWFLSQRGRILLLCTCLVVAVVAVYYPVSTHPFINYDDDVYILHNSHIKAGLN